MGADMTLLRTFLAEEEGATAIEYGLIAGLVSVVIIGALTLLGNNLSTVIERVAVALE
jgi:pilus assembly protein Flp/PilA